LAQWSHRDRTLYAKLVYYGPAFGGKTTNLESLHRLTDPERKHQLLTLPTVHDRTLFFDLLPFDLGDILGYQVAVKCYTVPGQVRYDTTRQVVLAGADALVFVADSSAERKDQNVWSLQNLRLNMRAKNLDPAKIPVLYQFNKQDLPQAASIQEVSGWLGVPAEQAIGAVAVDGRGVLETFMSACRLMLHKVVAAAGGRTRREIDEVELAAQLEQAFAPHLARHNEMLEADHKPKGSQQERLPTPVALDGDDLLRRSVETSVKLGEKLTTETARAVRLEREAEAMRSLSESLRSVGASFDRARIVDAALQAVHQTLNTPVVSLLRESFPGFIECEAVQGLDADPMASTEAAQPLLQRMLAATDSCLLADLTSNGLGKSEPSCKPYCFAAGAPLSGDGERAVLMAYAPCPDGTFSKDDLRFMATVAGHLATGLEKSRLHRELGNHRDELEATVVSRTAQLSEAYASLRQMELMKDRFLGNLSHEMKTPLAAILSAALVIRDYKSNASERRELVDGIVTSAETLDRQLEDLFRLVNLEKSDRPVELSEGEPEKLIQRAIQLSGHSGVQYTMEELPGPAAYDEELLARALANLIDNAVKFSRPSALLKICVSAERLEKDARVLDAMAISVLDRGRGVAEEDRERIFAPFEQGGEPLTSKPRGVGLGLHEARVVARKHGGELEYRPRDGGGSEFRLVVPLQATIQPMPQEAVKADSEDSRV